MSEDRTVCATFWSASGGHCDCCGHRSHTIWGDLADADGPRAAYFVQWTERQPGHMPRIDLVLGSWGDGALPADRVLVSLVYRPAPGGGSFMVIDGAGRPADHRGLCGRALARAEVVGTLLAQQVFALVDALWLTEPRIMEMRALDDTAF